MCAYVVPSNRDNFPMAIRAAIRRCVLRGICNGDFENFYLIWDSLPANTFSSIDNMVQFFNENNYIDYPLLERELNLLEDNEEDILDWNCPAYYNGPQEPPSWAYTYPFPQPEEPQGNANIIGGDDDSDSDSDSDGPNIIFSNVRARLPNLPQIQPNPNAFRPRNEFYDPMALIPPKDQKEEEERQEENKIKMGNIEKQNKNIIEKMEEKEENEEEDEVEEDEDENEDETIKNYINSLNYCFFARCPICYLIKKKGLRILNCGHRFCMACLRKSFSNNRYCPMCKNYNNLDFGYGNVNMNQEMFLQDFEKKEKIRQDNKDLKLLKNQNKKLEEENKELEKKNIRLAGDKNAKKLEEIEEKIKKLDDQLQDIEEREEFDEEDERKKKSIITKIKKLKNERKELEEKIEKKIKRDKKEEKKQKEKELDIFIKKNKEQEEIKKLKEEIEKLKSEKIEKIEEKEESEKGEETEKENEEMEEEIKKIKIIYLERKRKRREEKEKKKKELKKIEEEEEELEKKLKELKEQKEKIKKDLNFK